MSDNFRKVMSSTSLVGDAVINESGEDLGKIEELMLDLPSGKVAYAVLSFGGLLGLGDKLFAIPWDKLQVSEEDKKFILTGISKDQLKSAPGFDKDNWPDRKMEEEIYGFYGSDPYWKN
jgi:sporulation protein YlmC with PRC-barrel domain